jgi:flavodoxin
MKTLIVYYSRTGTTRKVAQKLAKELKADTEELKDLAGSRLGIKGWLISGKESTLKKLPLIKKLNKDLTKYDLIVIGTPVWAFTMASPVRTFIKDYKGEFKKVAFYCTSDGSPKNTIKNMEELSEKKAVARVELNRKELDKNTEKDKLAEFIKKIKK